MKNLLIFVFITAIVLVTACSSEKNTWTSKAYHNTTAHFNGYFYASEELRKVEQTILKNEVDDYNRILRLFPSFDSALAKGYDKEVQEAIKMASLAIQRHPNSKWVDDSYILVGKARHYSLDWGNAIQTFKHVNTKSKDKNEKHLAIISLIRTYIEHQEFNNALAAIDYLDKAKLNRTNEKKFLLEKAYYHQHFNDYDNMVRNLTKAAPMLKKKDRRGRVYFIVGQVYQKLGFESEAYNYYKKCLGTNPEYEVDFYARLYMAQVTEISKTKDLNAARKSFKKLLNDSKNKEFRDKIYYEMGVFELRHKNLPEAVQSFNLSIRTGSNKRIDGESFLKLGEIYYDTLKNYELSQAYYDSAINALPRDYEGYTTIKTRSEILNEFVKNLKVITWQDSLLTMSGMDSIDLKNKIEAFVNAKIKSEEIKKSKQKKRSNRVEIISNTNNNIFNNDDETGEDATANVEPTDWYFGNPAAKAIGQTEFTRVWGNITLQDNWRRSLRESARNAQSNLAANDSISSAPVKVVDPATAAAERVKAEYSKIALEIPRTESAKKESLKKIEDAYFNVGNIYHFKLFENDNAVKTYVKLLDRFPVSEYEPEVLYTLYLITKDSNPELAEQYATTLKSKHPNSTFAKILVNPAYLKESSLAVEKQKQIYKSAYSVYQFGKYDSANQILATAFSMGETSFTPTLKLLEILIIGETENISKYQYELEQFVKANEGNEIAAYAQKLLGASRDFQTNQEKRLGIQYIKSLEEPHYFVLVYKREEKLDGQASSALENFNESNFAELGLKTSNLILNDDYAITFVSELPRVSSAIEYFRTFNEKFTSINEFQNHKFNNFVITKDNFDIFYRTKGLDEYLQFFEKNYPIKDR